METIKRLGLTVATASVGIALFSGCNSVAPMANNTKSLETSSSVSGAFSNNRSFFDLKSMQKEKEVRESKQRELDSTSMGPIVTGTSRTTTRTEEFPIIPETMLMTYTVKKGDTLSHIARIYRVGVEELASKNDMDKKETLLAGTVLTLPSTASPRSATSPARWTGPRVHVVKKGDTLGHIAHRECVSVKDLKEWNGLKSDAIRAGQKLALGPGGTSAGGFVPRKRPIPKDGVHVVQSGENLSTIACIYGMKTRELKVMNNLTSDKIVPDQKLILRKELAKENNTSDNQTNVPITTLDGMIKYVVKSGDVLGRIANAHKVTVKQIMQANGLTDSRIKVGQELLIPTSVAPMPQPLGNEGLVDLGTKDTSASPKKPNRTLVPHYVDKDSDTLKGVAEMYGSTVAGILEENPTIKTDVDLRKATEISVPVPNLNAQ